MTPGLIRNVPQFTEALQHVKRPPRTAITLYRGQGNPHPLLPKLFRSQSLGFIRAHEGEILNRLKKKIPARTPSRPTNDWDWLSFGQHWGLATRLLDWTEDPLVALFFAIEKLPSHAPLVYLYHAQAQQIVDDATKRTSPFAIKQTRIMRPSVHSVRVALQKGWHTVHRLHPRKSGGEMVIPLNNMRWHGDHITTIRVDATAAPDIRKDLGTIGVTRATTYGDFDRICDSICTAFGIKR